LKTQLLKQRRFGGTTQKRTAKKSISLLIDMPPLSDTLDVSNAIATKIINQKLQCNFKKNK